MGIHNLMKLLGDFAPTCVKECEIKNYFGRKVAIDASMSLYQFLIAVRADGNMLTDDDGETTSHLVGLFYRTIRMVENGIKPVYVFDGKPPELKSGELEKRKEARVKAEADLKKAEEAGATEDVEKFNKRLVRVTSKHNEEAKTLLKLMGIPYVEAPGEAEASCAALVKAGKVFATASEDMDSLTFGSTVVLRHMTASEAKKLPIKELNLNKLLAELEIDMDKFIDLCILCGCDYTDSIKGVGYKRAMELIKKFGDIETILSNLDSAKYPPPEDWLFKEARRLFKEPEVVDAENLELKWSEPDEDGLVKFMCGEKNFSEDRIRSSSKRLAKARGGQTQMRMDSFFKTVASPASKRKSEDGNNNSNKKAKLGTKGTPGKNAVKGAKNSFKRPK